jgi:deoxyribodipyrimidine photo-lyase
MRREPEQHPSIVVFRDDLRLSDNAALAAAVKRQGPILCIFVFDEESPDMRPLGGAARWWLHGSLTALAEQLGRRGSRLDILCGRTTECIAALVEATEANAVFWNRRYGAAEMAADRKLKADLSGRPCPVESFNGRLLYEPWQIKPKAGDYYRVFTPFYRALLARGAMPPPVPGPSAIHAASYPSSAPDRVLLDDLNLWPRRPDWSGGLQATWQPGEISAQQGLNTFLQHGLADYAVQRDRPDLEQTSSLSPHLRFGEISPRQIWHQIHTERGSRHLLARDVESFLREIVWRDFCYHLLFHFPDLATRNFQNRFDAFQWQRPEGDHLARWQQGKTGYPIVDAGMRQLWQHGIMHNRIRMVTASFLTKDLLFDWRLGEAWFWDTLCDADPASNTANWQWVAGTGADAAPYFRVFNPVLQGEKFDPSGNYVKKFVPELARLPSQWIHRPWLAPAAALKTAGVELGKTYPFPLLDHATARKRALHTFEQIKAAPSE